MADRRLIDAYDLAETIENMRITVAGKPARWDDAKVSVLREISQAPDVDAVEVVRCKDCQRWDKSKKIINSCACSYWSPSTKECRFTLPDDFCSKGIKKEGAEKTLKEGEKND